MPSKARPDGCTGTGCFVLNFARTLHGHLLEVCDQLLCLIWTLSEYMKILNWKLTILLICNHYIKWICHPEYSQPKILTNSPLAILGQKNTWPIWKYSPGLKTKWTKNTRPFCHTMTKGKQSINENISVLIPTQNVSTNLKLFEK
jgi:hypothetical protein